jgi:Flp pilus assembly protein TadD
MAEFRVKGTTTWSPPNTVTASTPARGTNPLQDSFIRLEEAEQLRQQRKLDRAQKICESLIREHPDYMAAQHTLGLIYADRNNYQRALECLVQAAMLNPDSWKTLTALSGVYLRLGANEMAARVLEQARQIEPRDASVLVTLGEIYQEDREYDRAKDAYQQALELEANLLPAAFGLGWVYSFLGQNAEAAKVFEDLIKRGVRLVEPAFALASLPASVISIDVLAKLDEAVRAESEDPAEFENTAAFARAAALDGLGRFAEAWQLLVPANRTVAKTKQKELQDTIQWQRTTLAWLRTNPIRAARSSRDGETISLFILGPSRSGKTTLEQLVATLDGVKRGNENPIVENAIRRAFQTAGLITSSHFENLPDQLHPLCGDIYLKELTRRAGSGKVFTNTHPARIHDAASVAMAFPNIRFIFVKRNLEDVVLRIYQKKYRQGNAYAYDLKSARDYVVWYYQMMDLLAEKLPDNTRIVHYEDIVADPAGALRTVADLCGLPMPARPLPPVGDDRACSAPYRQFMTPVLAD